MSRRVLGQQRRRSSNIVQHVLTKWLTWRSNQNKCNYTKTDGLKLVLNDAKASSTFECILYLKVLEWADGVTDGKTSTKANIQRQMASNLSQTMLNLPWHLWWKYSEFFLDFLLTSHWNHVKTTCSDSRNKMAENIVKIVHSLFKSVGFGRLTNHQLKNDPWLRSRLPIQKHKCLYHQLLIV